MPGLGVVAKSFIYISKSVLLLKVKHQIILRNAVWTQDKVKQINDKPHKKQSNKQKQNNDWKQIGVPVYITCKNNCYTPHCTKKRKEMKKEKKYRPTQLNKT